MGLQGGIRKLKRIGPLQRIQHRQLFGPGPPHPSVPIECRPRRYAYHSSQEPGFGAAPFSHHGDRRDSDHLGCFLDAHPTKISQLDDSALAFIDQRKLIQRLVKRQKLGGLRLS